MTFYRYTAGGYSPTSLLRHAGRKRDEEMSQNTLNAIAILRTKLKPGKRLTPSAVAWTVGLNAWLISHLDEMPKSRSVLIWKTDWKP